MNDMKRASALVRLALSIMLGGCCFGGATSNPPLTLAPGFSPQPTTQTGATQSLIIDGASHLGWECQGWFSTEPQHVVNVTTPMFLRVIARGTSETRLAVRYPDGVYRCSDYMDSANVGVEAFAGVGRVEVFVGAPSSGQQIDYTVGFTETPGFPSSALP